MKKLPVLAAAAIAMVSLTATAHAQSAGGGQAPTSSLPLPTVESSQLGGPPPDNPSAPPLGSRPLRGLVAAMGRSAGVVVLADSTVSTRYVLPPTTATTAANLPAQLDALVRSLPSGCVWAKAYVPVHADRALNPDAVADYLTGLARLVGTVGAAPSDQVEILGQRLPPDQAAPIIAALNLKPVYLITNPRARVGWDGGSYAQMNPDDRGQYAQQQAQSILSASPNAGALYIQQQSEIMQAIMQMTPPQQQ